MATNGLLAMTDAADFFMSPALALPDAGMLVPISGSPIEESTSKSPHAGAVALARGGLPAGASPLVAVQLWPDVPSADEDQREGNARQWARFVH